MSEGKYTFCNRVYKYKSKKNISLTRLRKKSDRSHTNEKQKQGFDFSEV